MNTIFFQWILLSLSWFIFLPYSIKAGSLPDSSFTTELPFSQGRIENSIFPAFTINPALTGYELKHQFRAGWEQHPLNSSGMGWQEIKIGWEKGFKINPAFGIFYERASTAFIISNSIYFSNAWKIKLNKNNFLRIGGSVRYGTYTLQWKNLTFGDMIDKRYGFIYHAKETPGISSRGMIDFNGGLWYTGKKFFSGISILHMTQPYYGFISGISYRLAAEIFFTGGYAFTSGNIHLIPVILVKKNYYMYAITPSMFCSIGNTYLFGISYKNLNTVAAEAGIFLFDRLQILLSGGVPVSAQFRSFSIIGFAEGRIRYQFPKQQ